MKANTGVFLGATGGAGVTTLLYNMCLPHLAHVSLSSGSGHEVGGIERRIQVAAT